MRYKYSDVELKKLLKNLCIVIDTREQVNKHITDYFDKKKIKYKVRKLDQGDYSCYIESNEETQPLGVIRDWYFDNQIAIERKNSVDELIQSIKDRDRFENEFARLKMYNTKIFMFVEEENGYKNIIAGNYRSQYKPISAIGSLETFIARYDINVQLISKEDTAYRIFKTLYYHLYELLKNRGYIDNVKEMNL